LVERGMYPLAFEVRFLNGRMLKFLNGHFYMLALFAFVFGFAVPSVAQAASHKYVCSDFDVLSGGASCSSDFVDLQTSSNSSAKSAIGTFPVADGTTLYVQVDATIIPSDSFYLCLSNGAEGTCPELITSSGTAHQFTMVGNGTSGDQEVQAYSNGLMSAGSGFTNLCVSDVSYAEAAAACGGSPSPPTGDGVLYEQTGVGSSYYPTATGQYAIVVPGDTTGTYPGIAADHDIMLSDIAFMQLNTLDVCPDASNMKFFTIDGGPSDVPYIGAGTFTLVSDAPPLCVYSYSGDTSGRKWGGFFFEHGSIVPHLSGSPSNPGNTFSGTGGTEPGYPISGTPYFQVCNSDGCSGYTGVGTTTTAIISVVPYDGETVATSSSYTIGANVYVAPTDYVDGMTLEVSFFNQFFSGLGGVSALDAFNDADRALHPITFALTSGGQTLSTTTTDLSQYSGITKVQWSIKRPSFGSSLPVIGFFFSPTSLVSTSTQFIIGTSTPLDTALNESGAAFTDFLLTGSTTPLTLTNCKITDFELGACLLSLIVPTPDLLHSLSIQFYAGFATHMPFGYITRFVQHFTYQTPVMPPALSYTFGSSTPMALRGESVSFQVFDHFDKVLLIRADDGSNKNIYDIVDPYLRILVAIAVLMVVVHDVGLLNLSDFSAGVGKGLSRKESYKVSHPVAGDNMGRSAEDRRRLIAKRGERHDRTGGRGIIH